MIVVFIVVLVVFGPQKLPELARGLGKLMAEFRKASLDFRTAFEEEMRDLERQALIAQRRKGAEAAAASAATDTAAETIQPSATVTPAASDASTSANSAEAPITEPTIAPPVAESVPRDGEVSGESKTEAAPSSNLQDSTHDAQTLA